MKPDEEFIIEATGAAWEYLCSSASNPNGQFHVVSLNENFPAGTCSCIQWTCRINPYNRKTGDVKRCKHLLAVRERVTNYLISHSTVTK